MHDMYVIGEWSRNYDYACPISCHAYHEPAPDQDRSDEFRDGDGTLLPLWRFSSEKAKRKQAKTKRKQAAPKRSIRL